MPELPNSGLWSMRQVSFTGVGFLAILIFLFTGETSSTGLIHVAWSVLNVTSRAVILHACSVHATLAELYRLSTSCPHASTSLAVLFCPFFCIFAATDASSSYLFSTVLCFCPSMLHVHNHKPGAVLHRALKHRALSTNQPFHVGASSAYAPSAQKALSSVQWHTGTATHSASLPKSRAGSACSSSLKPAPPAGTAMTAIQWHMTAQPSKSTTHQATEFVDRAGIKCQTASLGKAAATSLIQHASQPRVNHCHAESAAYAEPDQSTVSVGKASGKLPIQAAAVSINCTPNNGELYTNHIDLGSYNATVANSGFTNCSVETACQQKACVNIVAGRLGSKNAVKQKLAIEDSCYQVFICCCDWAMVHNCLMCVGKLRNFLGVLTQVIAVVPAVVMLLHLVQFVMEPPMLLSCHLCLLHIV